MTREVVTVGHSWEQQNRANTLAVPVSVRQLKLRIAFAVIFLGVGRSEMQVGADAALFQGFHQATAGNAAGCFVYADDKQGSCVAMLPFWNGKRQEWRIGQLLEIEKRNLLTTRIKLLQFTQLHAPAREPR